MSIQYYSSHLNSVCNTVLKSGVCLLQIKHLSLIRALKLDSPIIALFQVKSNVKNRFCALDSFSYFPSAFAREQKVKYPFWYSEHLAKLIFLCRHARGKNKHWRAYNGTYKFCFECRLPSISGSLTPGSMILWQVTLTVAAGDEGGGGLRLPLHLSPVTFIRPQTGLG